MRIRDLTIKAKLHSMTVLGMVSLILVLGLAIWCLATFRVNGPVYREIIKDKDVSADILPPPLYIIESLLTLHVTEESQDPEVIQQSKDRVSQLQKSYNERYAHWKSQLPPGELKTALIVESSEPATRFFRAVWDEYFPALERGDHATAHTVLHGKIQDAYDRHRAAIDKTVKLAARDAAEAEAIATQRVDFWRHAMIIISIVAVIGLTLVRWAVTRGIVRSTGVLIDRVEAIAQGTADLTARVAIDSHDELGRLASGINATIAKMQDIVERERLSEAENTHLRHLLRNIIDSMPSVLVGVDAQTRVIQWNREAERLTGIASSAALGAELRGLLPQLKAKMEMVSTAVRERMVQKADGIPWDTLKGRQIADMTVYPLVANGVTGAVVRVDDASERVRFEQMMVQSEKMRTVAGLAAGMAHEINNPLAGMLQNAEVVLNRVSPGMAANQITAQECQTTVEAVQAYLERRGVPGMLRSIHESGQRAAEIISNMLSFSRAGELAMVPCDLAALVDQAVILSSSDFDLKKGYDFRSIVIVRDYAADLPPIPCRPSEIQQVILNLLKNAVQAMAHPFPGAAPPRLVLRTQRRGECVCIDIEDNGPGIPDEVRRRLFEPFFTTKGPQVGTGLGLFVSYLIITQNHGGTIEVVSPDGSGTRFTVVLPVTHRSGQ